MNLKPWLDFPPNSRNQWEETARQELQGESPFEKLKRTKGKINILPYYDQSDRKSKSIFSLPPSNHPFLGAKAWQNVSKVVVVDESQANKQALLHLSLGAEGVHFELPYTSVNVSRLLSGIQLPYCFTIFSGGVSESFQKDFSSYAKTQFDTSSINGLLLHPFLQNLDFTFPQFNQWSSFHSLGFWAVEKESAVETISNILRDAVSIVDRLTENGQSPTGVLAQIAIGVTTGSDFFLEIAKLKALRALLNLVCLAYKASTVVIHIHVQSSRWPTHAFQPHGNLLKSTTSGLAAVLGGCDSLVIEPDEPGNALLDRMARNLSLLFRDESYLANVADPVSGSYYLENLTTEMAEKSWTLFQANLNS